MRIYIAIIVLVAVTVIAAIALKASTSPKPDTKRDGAPTPQASVNSTEPAPQTPAGKPAVMAQQPSGNALAAPATNGAQPAVAANVTQTPAQTTAAKPNVAEAAGAGDDKKMDAAQLLALTRAALGGEAKLNEVKSLTASARMRRQTQNQDQSGTISLDFLLPDKFKRTETLSLIAGIEVTLIRALNGEQVWTDSRSSASNAQVMVSRPDAPNASATQLQDLRSEFSRYVLALLMTAPESLAAQFTYAGEAEAPDGRADVLDVKGANNFAMRLFIDKKTHLPLMLNYRGVPPRSSTSSSAAGSVSAEDLDKIIKDAQAKAAARKEAEITMNFSDYRSFNGINLPRLITRSVGGQTIEEWQSIQYKINPTDLKPQKFVK